MWTPLPMGMMGLPGMANSAALRGSRLRTTAPDLASTIRRLICACDRHCGGTATAAVLGAAVGAAALPEAPTLEVVLEAALVSAELLIGWAGCAAGADCLQAGSVEMNGS
jgi:hypothetical protein